MTGQESFEDRFEHDPNAVYEEEEDDFDEEDDEFINALPSKDAKGAKGSKKAKKGKKDEESKGGCLGGLFKILLSLTLIVCCYLYIFRPEQFARLQTKIISLYSTEKDAPKIDIKTKKDKKEIKEPILPLHKTELPSSEKKPAPAPRKKESVPRIFLRGSGTLSDYATVAQKRPALNAHLISANKITFETLDTHHELVRKMIEDWTEETDEQKIAEMVQMPYNQFFYRTSASLLSQTVLKNAGFTPVNTSQMLDQSPLLVMATVYPMLKEAMATKKTVQEQVKIFEPVSSFLIYVCRKDSECMASWDLLLDMLDVKQFAKRLEKAPETIYMRK